MFWGGPPTLISIQHPALIPELSFDTIKSAQKQKNAHFQKSATKAQKVLIWLFHFVGHPHMFKQPDPQAFLQHTLTQSHYA